MKQTGYKTIDQYIEASHQTFKRYYSKSEPQYIKPHPTQRKP